MLFPPSKCALLGVRGSPLNSYNLGVGFRHGGRSSAAVPLTPNSAFKNRFLVVKGAFAITLTPNPGTPSPPKKKTTQFTKGGVGGGGGGICEKLFIIS